MLCSLGLGRKEKYHNLDEKQTVMVVKRKKQEGYSNKASFTVHNKGTWEHTNLTPNLSYLGHISPTIIHYMPSKGNANWFSEKDGKL